MSACEGPINEITSLGKVVSESTKILAELFPGISIRSSSKAESKSSDDIIKDIRKFDAIGKELKLSEEFVSALMNDAVYRHSHNENFKSVLVYAAPLIKADARPASIDPSWSDEFRHHAEQAYDDEVRRTWAALLAGEINQPGSYSKHAMSALAEMSPEDAKAFQTICTACVVPLDAEGRHLDPMLVFVPDEGGSTVDDGLLTHGQLSYLETLGIVTFTTRSVLSSLNKGESIRVLAGDSIVTVRRGGMFLLNPKPSPALTSTGLELVGLCKKEIGR